MSIFNNKYLVVSMILTFVIASLSIAGTVKTDAEKIAIELAAMDNFDNSDIITDTQDYCASTYTNQTDDWITNVTFGDINNNSGQDGPTSYGDYTSLSTDVTPGGTYTLSVTYFSDGYTEHARVWFDWNADEIFDASECYYLGSGADITLTMDIAVPYDATAGTTRFRIIEQYNTDPGDDGACDGQGNHSTTYGETEDYSVNIGEPPLYDAAAVAFVQPGSNGQQGQPETPIVTFANYGSMTATFDVSLVIEYDGSNVYEESGSVEDLEFGETADVTFAEFTPAEAGDYILTATAMLSGDDVPGNDVITADFNAQPEILPPSGLSATDDQDGVVPLSWFEPGLPPCELLQYDDGVLGNAFYYYASDNLIANAFVAVAPVQICSVFVHVLTQGDEYWPWPDGTHEPVQLKIFDDAGDGTPGDMLGEFTATAELGMDIAIAIDPPIVCNTDMFWVAFNNVNDADPYDGLGLDAVSDYPQYHWVRNGGVWTNESLYDGDRMIRASIRSSGVALTLSGNNPTMDDVILDTQELSGYNLYRSTAPNVEVTPDNLIASDLEETSYDDYGVENGTTYYYVATAMYDDEIESGPSNEAMGIPAAPGELSVDPDDITFNCPLGQAGSVELELANSGGLDVYFDISCTTNDNVYVQGETPYNPYSSQAAFSSTKYEGEKTFQVSDYNPPLLLDSGGPDAFGYKWIDSDEPNGPEFNWIDPSSHEQYPFGDDDNQGPFGLAFGFPFYGEVFNTVNICSNGFISFSSGLTAYTNTELPNPDGPLNLIAPFWEDLNPSTSGIITFYTDDDMTVISWVDVPAYDWDHGVGPETFQVILYPNGKIKFQYLDLNDPLEYCTIGIQNGAGDVGLQVAFDQAYVHNDLAIMFMGSWLSVNPPSGVVPAGGSVTVDVMMDASDLDIGIYQGNLSIGCYDVNHQMPDMDVPVTLDVVTGIEDQAVLPESYALSQNYPNPFNAKTSIEFALPEPADVELTVYNMLGQKVATLVNEHLGTGMHSVVWDASDVSSGVYFYKIAAGEYTEIQEMTLLK